MLIITKSQPIVHNVAQAIYEDPCFMYYVIGPQSEIQGEAGDIEEFKEQCQTIEKRLRAI